MPNANTLQGDGTSDGIAMSIEQYLHTSFRPDCDLVDGKVQERLWGEYDHATTQHALLGHFHKQRGEWKVQELPSVRIRVSAERVRVPDVMVLREDHPYERVIVTPPLACIEILSPEDRFGRMTQKIADYLQMGVGAVWVIDPSARTGYDCRGGYLSEWVLSSQLTVAGTPIKISVAALFDALD